MTTRSNLPTDDANFPAPPEGHVWKLEQDDEWGDITLRLYKKEKTKFFRREVLSLVKWKIVDRKGFSVKWAEFAASEILSSYSKTLAAESELARMEGILHNVNDLR